MTSTISSKGQITLPARLRKRFGLRPGMKLEFDEAADFLAARPAFDPGEMHAVLGCASALGKGAVSQKILREQRGYERSEL
ncbi:MAG: AbrB/MazE/SpoVT family DNA-binding domain-containing protein [Verrucomicrobiota bacterium]